jgi:hypothetical protein
MLAVANDQIADWYEHEFLSGQPGAGCTSIAIPSASIGRWLSSGCCTAPGLARWPVARSRGLSPGCELPAAWSFAVVGAGRRPVAI